MVSVTRIMPLRASNTYSMYADPSSPGGYRGPLQYMLQSQGGLIDFVGLDRDGAIFDSDHNGDTGKTIDRFTRPVNETAYEKGTSSTRFPAGQIHLYSTL